MSYIIGIYAEDYLTLLEISSRIEAELPLVQIKIFGGERLVENLPAEVSQYISADLQELKQSDFLLFIDDMPDSESFLQTYYGKVLYANGSQVLQQRAFEQATELRLVDESVDVCYFSDPLLGLLHEMALLNEGLHFNISLPLAIYGVRGVDALMQETRAIYSFEDYDRSPLSERIAFNFHVYEAGLPEDVLDDELKKLRTVSSVALRLNPISTVFSVDVFSKYGLAELPDADFDIYEHPGDFTAEDVSRDNKIAKVTYSENAFSLFGDYMHMKTTALISLIKKMIENEMD